AERAGLPGELTDEGQGCTCLLDPDVESCQDVPAGLPGGVESAAEAGEGVRDPRVQGEPGGAGDHAERADPVPVRAGEQGCGLETVHADGIGGGERGDVVEALPDLGELGAGGEPPDCGVAGADRAAEQAVAGDLGVEAQQLLAEGECACLGEAVADVVA